MQIIAYLLISALALWCLISTIITLRSVFVKQNKELHQSFFLGGLLGLIFVFSGTFWLLLFFIPNSWGYINKYGDYETIRHSLSITLGVISGILFPFILEKWWEKKRLMSSPEIKTVFHVLDEAKRKFEEQSQAFSIVQEAILSEISSQGNEITKTIRNSGKHPQIWVYSMICNLSGNYAANGQHHIYRGVLDFTGERYRDIFCTAIDELVKLEEINKELAKEQKLNIRKNIASVG